MKETEKEVSLLSLPFRLAVKFISVSRIQFYRGLLEGKNFELLIRRAASGESIKKFFALVNLHLGKDDSVMDLVTVLKKGDYQTPVMKEDIDFMSKVLSRFGDNLYLKFNSLRLSEIRDEKFIVEIIPMESQIMEFQISEN